MPASLVKFLQRYRVFLGFVFAAVFFVFSRPRPLAMAIGFIVVLIGLVFRAWAAGHLRKIRELDSSGPYAYTTNPLYFGSFLIMLGFAIASSVWWLALLAVVFFLSIYLPVMNVEKRELATVLGDEYREYAQNVPLFVPSAIPWKKGARRFDFQLYLKNGEYNASIGSILAAAVLAAKVYIY